MRYQYAQLLQTGDPSYPNDIAEQYRVPHIIRSVFDPECDAYRWVDPESPTNYPAGSTTLRGMPADASNRNVEIVAAMQETREGRPFTMEEMKKIVDQNRFGIGSEGVLCGAMIGFWPEEVGTIGELVETKGEVTASGVFKGLDVLWGENAAWEQVYGLRGALGFVEDDSVKCDDLHVSA